MSGLLGKKIRMTQIFEENGKVTPVTILSVGPCYVTQIKTLDKDGYDAIQIGYGKVKDKHVIKPQAGHFKKAEVSSLKHLREFDHFSDREVKIGDELKVDIFSEGERVQISSRAKGRGFQGVMKRHKFSGANKTHGQSDRWRAPGSLGQSSYPSRVFKGSGMAGRMGNNRKTIPNTRIVKIDPERNLIFVKGPVPGATNSLVEIKKL
jgi:large subunit ribosomal protein L3